MKKVNIKLQNSAPLYDALKKYSTQDIAHFDVPGHKKRNSPELIEAFGEKTLRMDANSTPALDMLGNPTGIIAQAEKLLADAYYADSAFFLVNGSTSGVQYMILTACKPKDKIIMPRNVHKSAINALILSGAQPVFMNPQVDFSYGIMNGVTYETVKKTIQEHPDAKAVFLVNPTYFGVTSDLSAIVALAHRHKMAVLVDESHGTHFPFHPYFPQSAMRAGADIATISVHKTGGSLTQSSALLLNERYFTRSQVRTVINLLQTTSASYLLMASLDIARRKLALHGRTIFNRLLPQVAAAKEKIAAASGLSVLVGSDYIDNIGVCGYDETKIVVKVNELGLTGFEAYDILKKDYNVQAELAETYVVLFIASIGDDEETLTRLVEALCDMSHRFYGKRAAFTLSISRQMAEPRAVISPREAYYADKRAVRMDDAAGEVCGESIMIYPPGIPLAIPGERITAEIIEHYKFYQTQNCTVINDEENQNMITVLGQ